MKSALLLLLAGCSLLPAAPARPGTNSLVIRAGRLIDTANGRVLERQVIFIEGNEIRVVADEGSATISSNTMVLDLSQATVLPGLIDCHTHITSEPGENYYEGIQLMKERGTFLISDVYNDDYILAEYGRRGYPEKIIEKERTIGRLQRENFQRAVKAGVKIAYGTDAGVYPHGWNGKQFIHMVRWGMTPMQAIQAATANAAELLGQINKLGGIAPGRWADIIAVKGDPLTEIELLENIPFVMKGGIVIKDTLAGKEKD